MLKDKGSGRDRRRPLGSSLLLYVGLLAAGVWLGVNLSAFGSHAPWEYFKMFGLTHSHSNEAPNEGSNPLHSTVMPTKVGMPTKVDGLAISSSPKLNLDSSDAPHDPPRLLFMAAVYTFKQFLYLQKALDCMRDHCNNGWNVTVHLQVANGLAYDHPRYTELADRAWCATTQRHIPIILDAYGKIGFGLNYKHRRFVREHLEELDYFSYAEEDMLLYVTLMLSRPLHPR